MAYVFGLPTLWLIDSTRIFQLKSLKSKNNDHTNFYECCDLTKKSISNLHTLTPSCISRCPIEMILSDLKKSGLHTFGRLCSSIILRVCKPTWSLFGWVFPLFNRGIWYFSQIRLSQGYAIQAISFSTLTSHLLNASETFGMMIILIIGEK